MNKLPMNFDWRSAKQNAAQSNPFQQLNPYQQRQQTFSTLNSGVKGQGELVESLLSHAQLQVLKFPDTELWEKYGKNPYTYVVETFIKPMMLPYINMHKIDGNGILYIATNIQNMDQSDTPLNEGMSNGFMQNAVESGGFIYINKQVLVKAISDMCL